MGLQSKGHSKDYTFENPLTTVWNKNSHKTLSLTETPSLSTPRTRQPSINPQYKCIKNTNKYPHHFPPEYGQLGVERRQLPALGRGPRALAARRRGRRLRHPRLAALLAGGPGGRRRGRAHVQARAVQVEAAQATGQRRQALQLRHRYPLDYAVHQTEMVSSL